MKKRKEGKWIFARKAMYIIILLSLIFGEINSDRVVVYAENENTPYQQTMSSAKEIAKVHLREVVEQGDQIGTWNTKTKVENGIPLCNTEEEICAYVFQLKNKKKDAGYIVVGGNDEQPPIIEYATSGKFCADNLKDDEYIIFDGFLNYYKAKEDSNKVVELHDESIQKKKHDIKIMLKKEKGSYKDEWENLDEQTTAYKSSSAPNTNASIKTPGNYESGYTSVKYVDVPAATYVFYFTVASFPGYAGHCVPTAATNLLYYWHERKYWTLIDGTWENTFAKLYRYMDTTPDGGTGPGQIPWGLNRYLEEINVHNANIWVYYDPTWSQLKEEIEGGAPFIYGIPDYDGDDGHAVLALGYAEYKYSSKQSATGNNYSRYLRVADGAYKEADRFVRVKESSSSRFMASCYFIGK